YAKQAASAGRCVVSVDRRYRTLAQIAVLCLLAALAALVVTVIFFHGLLMLVAVLSTVFLTAIGGWWFLARRGVLRWIGAGLAAAAPVVLIVVSTVAGFWLDGVVVALL